MKKLQCEVCGSTEIKKIDDSIFECQSCGVQYDKSEVQKLFVEITGEVKIDRSKDAENLLIRAQQFLDNFDFTKALEYYNKVLDIDPNNIEALNKINAIENRFGKVFIYAQESRSVADSITIYINGVVQGHIKGGDDFKFDIEQDSIIDFLWNKSTEKVSVQAYAGKVKRIILKFGQLNLEVEAYDYDDRFDDLIEGNEINYAVEVYCEEYNATKSQALSFIEKRQKEIKLSNSDNASEYQTKTKTSSGGCYVATCVYGSYDCPQVWTLRRFRDDTLASTWYGRAFIHTYYAISPTIVKWFGNTEWFKKMWRGKLDRMVKNLQLNGVKDTPYNDKDWR